jgi:hypothetical protein
MAEHQDRTMRFTALLFIGVTSSAAWLAMLLATGFSAAAVGAGLVGVLYLEGKATA